MWLCKRLELTCEVFAEFLFHFNRTFVCFLRLLFCHASIHFPGNIYQKISLQQYN